MRWQTLVRLLLGATLIGVSALVALQWREREVPVEPPVTVSLSDPTAQSESEGGKLEIFDGDVVAYTIDYGKRLSFADGRNVFQDATIRFARGGVPHVLSAPETEAVGKAGPAGNQPERLIFRRGVTLTAEGGVAVRTLEEATFYNNEQKVVMPGAMTFERGRLSGGGVGADLYMDRSVLWINDQATLTVAPDAEGGAPIEARARRIGLAEADHYMVLEDQASMTHQTRRLSAAMARVSFTPVGDTVQYIELRGQSAVRSLDPRAADPQLTAENINLEFAPDTGRLTHTRQVGGAVIEIRETGGVTRVAGSEIDTFVGPDGETLTKLQATAPVAVALPRQDAQPARTIDASWLLAEGSGTKGLDRAVFDGGITYRESRPGGRGAPAETRVVTARSLQLRLAGDLADVESATFRQDVKIVDGRLTATAETAVYDSAAETLQLRAGGDNRAARPRVVDAELEVDASEIDADLKTDAFDARATGADRVESFFKPGARAPASPSGQGLFEAGQPIAGASSRLQYSRTTGLAVYQGAAYLRQGESSLAGDRIEFDDRRSDVRATGKVVSRLDLDPEDRPASGAAQPVRISANALVYTESARTGVYTGGVVFDGATGEQLRGDRLTLQLEKNERRLASMEGTAAQGGEVRITLLEGRQSAGARVLYNAASDTYQVFGAPALFIAPAPDRGPGECSVTSATELRFNRTAGTSEGINRGGAVGVIREAKCAEVIK